MRARLAGGAKLALLAAIVASLVYWPAALVVVSLFGLAGVSAQNVVTVGGALGTFAGMLVWWLLLFVLLLAGAALVFPWNVKHDGFGK